MANYNIRLRIKKWMLDSFREHVRIGEFIKYFTIIEYV